MLFLLLPASMVAQVVNIGGDVYGGGRNGAVGTAKTTDNTASKDNVTLTEDAFTGYSTNIVINSGNIRTVFGGGENGRTYGNTSVVIQGENTQIGGTINDVNWSGTIHGGLFGAGDGEEAYVFGNSSIMVTNGTMVQNVYGGGNRADLMGTASVTLRGGTLEGAVFGGARLANVFGYSYVNIDGSNAVNDLVIGEVYGGNDIGGNVLPGTNWSWTQSANLSLPTQLNNAAANGIDNTWNAFVKSSLEAEGKHIFVGQLFGGGNGDYVYTVNGTNPALMDMSQLTERVRNEETSSWDYVPYTYTVSSTPEVSKVYLELEGGTFGYVYGGGNNATVTSSVDICLNNETLKSNLYAMELDNLRAMGVGVDEANFTVSGTIATPTYQFDRVFGGNNKATMDIHPNWHLMQASVNNLYSGGNAGNMTYYDGLLLAITGNEMEVNNVYGGCRMAHVAPSAGTVPSKTYTFGGTEYTFPAGHSARVLVTAGKINNVYGGNDISGNVTGGNAIEIRSSILHDVYGGGNGSYAYTDNAALANHETYGDYYYDKSGFESSAQALNAYRPTTEQVWIHVVGTEANPTVIGGSLYCGGNSATINATEADVNKHAKINIGSYVIANNVFMGSNGENMVAPDMLAMYHNGTVDEQPFSSINLSSEFAEYMKGVAVAVKPELYFDNDYVDNTTQIGSFYFGGNVGSMTASGTFDLQFNRNIVIYEKVVAGCNNANYTNAAYGIDYEGGISTAPATGNAKIELALNGINLKPGKLTYNASNQPVIDWNTTTVNSTTRLIGGNIYGGCYQSGEINGDVIINLTTKAMNDAQLFAEGGASNSGAVKNNHLNDVFDSALSLFGGGYGIGSTVKGNTTINLSGQANILKVFGGGLEGVVNGNTTINLTGGEAGKIYGGGFEGTVLGNTAVYLDGGTVSSSFGGACNADINGYAHTYIGTAGTAMTTVQNHVYGGNDFGGTINGEHSFANRVRTAVADMVYNPNSAATPAVLTTSAYVEYEKGIIKGNIFGGSCGAYDYADEFYASHIVGEPLPHLASSFVYFKANAETTNRVGKIFGAGQGSPSVTDGSQDKMQQRSYVLVDAERQLTALTDTVFTKTEIFGGGAYSGLGMGLTPAEAEAVPESVSAVVDLVRGHIKNAYGASYSEGVTRRTVVNVPQGSEIYLSNIFGGGYGSSIDIPCDAYEANVNYSSNDAQVNFIYGGNNNSRRTLYSKVNVNSKVFKNKSADSLSTVYGAGCGENTWAQYTEVNLNNGALVGEVYGGGYGGRVLNIESLAAWQAQTPSISTLLGNGYIDNGLDNSLVKVNGLGTKCNANVYIYRGAQVGDYKDNRPTVRATTINGGYGYGGGYGNTAVVSGTTYVGLHGGRVWKDLYAGGTYGGVMNQYENADFTAQANAFIEGGSVRNVYGAGYRGRVGYTELPFNDVTLSRAQIAEVLENDRPGISNVVVGIRAEEAASIEGYGFYKGVPTVERNVYGSGEDGGAVLGLSKVTMNNGYVGYRYFADGTDDPKTKIDDHYVEKLNDETWWDYSSLSPSAKDSLNRLLENGNLFGGGYADNASADDTHVIMYGGYVRNSVYGGGEIAAVGRGEAIETVGNAIRQLKGIYKSGSTKVSIYDGYIMRNVFGGGKGFNSNGSRGELFTNGYVFGQTSVNIHGGDIGTAMTVAEGDGNVFGGGNIGYVFNSSNNKRFEDDGYYYKYDYLNNNWITVDGEKQLTEDCQVVISPYSKVLAPEGIDLEGEDGITHFNKNEFVPTDYLNRLLKNNPAWETALDVSGVTVGNAVFAGGNVSSGNELYVNTTTVFGNATATLNDLYYCDLITIGSEHIGGLYGDGNLTRVDGYRELNITNYGTDYYGVNTERVTIEEYYAMNDRERAYFEVKYECIQEFTKGGTTYAVGTRKTGAEIKEELLGTEAVNLDGTPNSDYWVEYGFVSIYAGRLINTIQRADFVGVFGSRMVMQGARDRIPEVIDFTNYTINRVGEVSLNRTYAPDNSESHGNYFGIYNVVNYLGALTSDVDMNEVRRTDNPLAEYQSDVPNQSYRDWKYEHRYARKRNNGKSDNKVALAAGVFLELNTENGTPENKDWGIVTGVLELDLINAMPGLGGGYVYAKNIHGTRQETGLKHTILSKYNKGANSNKKYSYSEPGTNDDWQTSGNFINSVKQIVDDCYPEGNNYLGQDAAPAHYWYLKGQVYLYDQYISAFTGAASAYNKTVNIPLTITAGSHGIISLIDIKANKYAYYSDNGSTPLGLDEKVIVNNITYHLNDTISYWDWSQLNSTDKLRFVDETYVVLSECKIGEQTYPQGYTLLPQEYDELLASLDGDKEVYHVARGKHVPFTDVFRPSNNLNHDNGFALTVQLTNPMMWDDYYTPQTGSASNKLNTETYQGETGYYKAPTYRAINTGVYGQREYERGDIITEDTYNTSMSINGYITDQESQATFDEAYVLFRDIVLTNPDGSETYWNKGLVIPKSDYTDKGITSLDAGKALFCVDTWRMEGDGLLDEYIFYGTSITETEIREQGTAYGYSEEEMNEVIAHHFSKAYYCTKNGKFGGNYYVAGTNYQTLDAWSAMNPEDRENFEFNYDALDLLIDPQYSGNPALYDGDNSQKVYSIPQRIDYTAKYYGDDPINYTKPDGTPVTINQNDVISNIEYEDIPNEQYHYASFYVTDKDATYYIVRTSFSRGDVSYAIGNSISAEIYNALNPETKNNVDVITGGFPSSESKYYYCRHSYTIGSQGTVSGANGNVDDVLDKVNGVLTNGSIVPPGMVITESNYDQLPNLQKQFTVNGKTPTETSTLYVSQQSNMQDLSKGKVFTITYEYSYDESDESGKNIEQITEKHIVNIYVQFKGGNPTIGQLANLSTILPGSTVGVTQPRVTPGAYEVIGGGWEIFANASDAENHVNGSAFDNTNTKLYWYHDGYYLAYYAKTYLGKTYSNAVPFSVGNYHDLDKVMADKENHMYVDHPNVKRNSKIYIDDRLCNSDANKNELDLLRDFHELSLATRTYDSSNNPLPISGGTLDGHTPMNAHVHGTENLEFILTSDIAPQYYTDWTPIGTTQANCFEGNLHGDGYTISGLNNSLFGYLCGNVYNLGVTGSFTTAGIANNGGYAENCWIMTSSTADLSGVKAIMGNGVIRNGYYPETNSYSQESTAMARPLSAFHNGEVAYNLNGFYLNKRYEIANNTVSDPYFYTIEDVNTNTLSTLPEGCDPAQDYVATRFRDGDFIYAKGVIPTSNNERMFYLEPAEDEEPDVKNRKFFPIYPDDYIYFGQMLTYGYGNTYEQYPSNVHRESRSASAEQNGATLWLTSESSGNSNRVYRAPAYFSNSTQDLVHFNANAVLPATIRNSETEVHKGLTAVDLSGYNDNTLTNDWTTGVYMSPILDYNGLAGFRTDGQTKNILIYIDDADESKELLKTYLSDLTFDFDNASYGTVSVADPANVKGHLVVKNGGTYKAATDQFLVDKQDFNAPISYSFDGNYMWYQRTPERYVSSMSNGWEGISLPFTAEYVTTQTKGEITHFYSGSKQGHEYWLREYSAANTTDSKVEFITPTGSSNKTVNNTFLWDYYYSKNSRKDANNDEYQQYYNESRSYSGYPLLTAATPYLIGFPGARYYEFDLSGTFRPTTTATSAPAQLDPQVITFVSIENQVIGVTDSEYEQGSATDGSFTYKPTYQSKSVSDAYMLTNVGDGYAQNATATTVPFRPYITQDAAAPAPSRAGTRGDVLYISNADDNTLEEVVGNRGLNIYTEHLKIYVENTLDYSVNVTITSISGVQLTKFTIQPGTKVTVPVNGRGVYIVNHKKIAVR